MSIAASCASARLCRRPWTCWAQPTETVTGQKNEFKDGVLYRDVDGQKGNDYYHRSDQKVRLFFAGRQGHRDLHDPQ